MSTDTIASLRVTIASLTFDELERLLRDLDLSPAALRQRRLDQRDVLIRETVVRYYGYRPRTAAARALAADLAALLDVAADAPAKDARTATLRKILALNAGRPLRWRQLAEIVDGWRGY